MRVGQGVWSVTDRRFDATWSWFCRICGHHGEPSAAIHLKRDNSKTICAAFENNTPCRRHFRARLRVQIGVIVAIAQKEAGIGVDRCKLDWYSPVLFDPCCCFDGRGHGFNL